MKVDLQTLEELVRNEMLSAANEAINYDGRFVYQKKQYIAKKLPDKSIEIEIFQLVKYKIDNLSQEKKQEFKEKIDLAKRSNRASDKKFKIENISVEVKEIEAGKFIIHTYLTNPANE